MINYKYYFQIKCLKKYIRKKIFTEEEKSFGCKHRQTDNFYSAIPSKNKEQKRIKSKCSECVNKIFDLTTCESI